MRHRVIALPLTVVALLVALLGLLAGGSQASGSTASVLLCGLLSASQLAWHGRRLRMSRLLLWPALGWLVLSLLSYLLPEHWVAHASWNRWATHLMPGSYIDDWRPPLLVMLCLTLLGLVLLVRTRANLGAPLLLGVAALSLVGQAIEQVHDHDLLPLTANGPVFVAQACLLLGQSVDILGGWRASRGSIQRALWPSLLLALLTLALWHHQREADELRLRADIEAQGQRLAGRLSSEINAHLAAMRRFTASWSWRDSPPTATQWAHQAELYHHDFRYFLNIAFITPDSRILRVHPGSRINNELLDTRLFDAQPEGREALGRALHDGRVGRTGIISLLQEQPGLIHYLPVIQDDSGRILGAVGVVVGLQAMADTLFRQVGPETTALSLLDGERLLAYQGPAERQGPWRHAAMLDLSGLPLTLVTRPGRDTLLAHRSRLPGITLTAGLSLAYLLYLSLFARHRMLVQHRQVRRSNRELRREVRSRTQLQREIEWLADHDDLTRLPNRRRFMQVLAEHAETRPLSVLLCDVDHFKLINDRHGHLTGDRYLAELGRLGQGVIETAGGVFARFGGEEFVACLPGQDADGAAAVAERLRLALTESGLRHRDGAPLTLSVGVATLETGSLVADDLLQDADEALYRAKSRGRDRVERASPRPGLSTGGV
ncbi:GGDEF domain-containing protein [Halomonas organivorans]|uniref:diguanylate cyclase n=1 Tax=Halomonas organivorans TaxID=257772 RepID=A0A7W5BXL7_9GAMM|nr:diguanylate cyclase [Halomonas organivorans]MBB3141025.1 diguanylate cyclase (GGDEF)-like protein [Halomonas organivorans]